MGYTSSNVTALYPPRYVFDSQQAAHNELMLLAAEVIREIVAAGGKPPPVSRMLKDLDRLWDVWRLFADPRGNHGTSSGTQH